MIDAKLTERRPWKGGFQPVYRKVDWGTHRCTLIAAVWAARTSLGANHPNDVRQHRPGSHRRHLSVTLFKLW